MIDGPPAQMLDIGLDALMGFILWCSEQGPTTLEGFQLGDATGDTVDLRARDLEALRFSEIVYSAAAKRPLSTHLSPLSAGLLEFLMAFRMYENRCFPTG